MDPPPLEWILQALVFFVPAWKLDLAVRLRPIHNRHQPFIDVSLLGSKYFVLKLGF
jgi:hypothetical protein